jgi:hypothetical protein
VFRFVFPLQRRLFLTKVWLVRFIGESDLDSGLSLLRVFLQKFGLEWRLCTVAFLVFGSGMLGLCGFQKLLECGLLFLNILAVPLLAV